MGIDEANTMRDEDTGLAEDSPPTVSSRGPSVDTWLLVAGVLMVLTGVALVVLPTVLPAHAWIARSLANRGVTALPIAISGVMLFGLSLTSRLSRAQFLAAMRSNQDDSPSIDHLANQVAHLGDGLQALRIEFVYLKDVVQSGVDRVQSAAPPENSSDAVYRLAASLDQVGMRIEERFLAGHREVSEALRAITSAIETVRASSAELRDAVEETAAKTAQPTSGTGNSAPSADADSARLGILDMLDDLGRILPDHTERRDEDLEIEYDPYGSVQDEGWKSSAPAAPLPSARGEELRLGNAAELLGRGFPREGAVGTKLEELRHLLADERVREALASLERSRR